MTVHEKTCINALRTRTRFYTLEQKRKTQSAFERVRHERWVRFFAFDFFLERVRKKRTRFFQTQPCIREKCSLEKHAALHSKKTQNSLHLEKMQNDNVHLFVRVSDEFVH